MGTEAADGLDFGPQRVLLVVKGEDRRRPLAAALLIGLAQFLDPPPQGILPHVADNQHRVAFIVDLVPQVMQDSPALAHSRTGKDDMRSLIAVERHRVLHRMDELQILEAEGVAAVLEKGPVGVDIVSLRVFAEDMGDVGGQRAVDIDRDLGQLACHVQFMEKIDQFLGPAEGKGRYQDRAAPRVGLRDDATERRLHIDDRIVQAIAVRALHDQQIDIAVLLGKLQRRVLDDRFAESADIAGEHDGAPLSAGPALEDDDSRAENMAGIIECAGQIPADDDRMTIRYTLEILQRLLGGLNRVERLDDLEVVGAQDFFDQRDVEILILHLEGQADLMHLAL